MPPRLPKRRTRTRTYRRRKHCSSCLKLWPLLVKNDNLDGDIKDWLAGRIDFGTLSEIVERSVDQPWAYHSMPVEAVAVGRPIVEANLRSLVATAAREQPLEKRLPLIAIAEEATHHPQARDHANGRSLPPTSQPERLA